MHFLRFLSAVFLGYSLFLRQKIIFRAAFAEGKAKRCSKSTANKFGQNALLCKTVTINFVEIFLEEIVKKVLTFDFFLLK